MKFLHPLVLSLAGCLAAGSLFAWGDEGHRAMGAMADQLITGTPAAARVRVLLGEESLATASVWADQIKGNRDQTPEMIQFKTANPHNAVSHYTDIPFEEAHYRDDSVGATSVDIVHAIPACILILQGKAQEQNIFQETSQRIALRLLVHFIEDIHQPLHVGTGYLDGTKYFDPNVSSKPLKDDQGANRLLFGGTNRLHYFWDVTVVQLDMQNAHAQTPGEYAAKLLSLPQPAWKNSGPMMDWDREWADESLALSAKAHNVIVTDEEDTELNSRTGRPRTTWHIQNLSPEYLAWAEKTSQTAMTKAGYRVAETLEAIWPDQP